MTSSINNTFNGIYLVADAGLEHSILLKKLFEALEAGISVIQLYNADNERVTAESINAICFLSHSYNVPVLINNNWELLKSTIADGVHFDKIPNNIHQIKAEVNRAFYKGITCNNDLSVIEWANNNQFNYISFCSMFPTSSADSCEIVTHETVKRAREITSLPVFLAGGIKPDNIDQLANLSFNGIALISGIMSATDITSATKKYISQLKQLVKNETRNY